MGRVVNINDGVQSLYTDLGAKSEAVSYNSRLVRDRQLMNAYTSSWIVSKYVDKTTRDMLKKPREFTGSHEQSVLDEVFEIEKRLKIKDVLNDALTWANLLGDCLIVAITDDEDLSQPITDYSGINKFIVLPKGDYSIGSKVNEDIRSEHYGMPEAYTIKLGNETVHASRCHRIRLGKFSVKDSKKFGISPLQAPFETIKLFDTVITCIADIIEESNVDVLYLPDLLQKIAAGQEDQIKQYAHLMKQTKASSKMIILDAGTPDSQGRWEQKTATYSGLSEILTKLMSVLAGALDRPITVLFGQSASGFASGEEDNRAYYETILNMQESLLRPLQEFIDKFILNLHIPDIKFEYPSIDSVNESEEATIFSQICSAIAALVTAQIIPDEVAQKELIARECLINTKLDDFKEFNLTNETESSWQQNY